MRLHLFTNRKPFFLVFLSALLAVLLVVAGSPYALGQSVGGHQSSARRMVVSAQEIPCHLWTVDVDDVPLFDAHWFTESGNSVQVRIKGNFACSTMPSVSDPRGALKGKCTRANGMSEAVYLDPRTNFGQTDVHVGFNEMRVGLVYHLSFAEFGTPLIVFGY
jgi:hypothetical protein